MWLTGCDPPSTGNDTDSLTLAAYSQFSVGGFPVNQRDYVNFCSYLMVLDKYVCFYIICSLIEWIFTPINVADANSPLIDRYSKCDFAVHWFSCLWHTWESHRVTSGRCAKMKYFTSISSRKPEHSSLSFSFEKLYPLFERARSSYVLCVFTLIHLPEATGICKWEKDKKKIRQEKIWTQRKFSWDLFLKEKKYKLNWKHPTKSVWSCKMLKLGRGWELPRWSRGVWQFQTGGKLLLERRRHKRWKK